jgi:cell division protein FtsB
MSEDNQMTKKRMTKPEHKRKSVRSIVFTIIGCAFIVFAAVIIYPVSRSLYLIDREMYQLDQEKQIVSDLNQTLEENNQILRNPSENSAAIADLAREQLGMVMSGETAVNITGLTTTGNKRGLPGEVSINTVEAESGWWTDFLDFFFVVSEQSETEIIDEPFAPGRL